MVIVAESLLSRTKSAQGSSWRKKGWSKLRFNNKIKEQEINLHQMKIAKWFHIVFERKVNFHTVAINKGNNVQIKNKFLGEIKLEKEQQEWQVRNTHS